ncbi:MAG TPA: hypothetical protein VG435_13225 [Acidimicrobiales bacterium]|jgi:hypothetical protein|nr:hypothetical protein [Acidimicrobiales bacterium]
MGGTHHDKRDEKQRLKDKPDRRAPVTRSEIHMAGNRAMTNLLSPSAPASIQRVKPAPGLTMKASDLDSDKGRKPLVGRSSYIQLQARFAKFEKAKAKGATEQVLADMLADLDAKVTKWLNEHRRNLDDRDAKRRQVIERLNDQLTEERAQLSKKQAHEAYMKSVETRPGNKDYEHGFKGLTGRAPADARGNWQKLLALETRKRTHLSETPDIKSEAENNLEKRRELAEKHGLSDAEQASFGVYTQSTADYEYINPVGAGQTGTGKAGQDRLAGARANAIKEAQDRHGTAQGWTRESNQTLREEGSLHTAMVMSGLQKLDRYEGTSYRGESLTESTFRERAQVGKKFGFPNLTSTSKEPHVATRFARGKPTKDVSVYWVFNNAGKDVEAFSMVQEAKEGEVLIEPSDQFVIDRIVDFDKLGADLPSEGLPLYELIKKGRKQNPARKVFVVHVMSAPTQQAPLPPSPFLPAPMPPLPRIPSPQ